MTQQQLPPPAGWYPDQTGYLRWWDGIRWGPYAPPPAPPDQGRPLAVLSHLRIFIFGVVVPLVIYSTEGQKNAFVRHHSREALNFQLSVLLVWLGGFALFFVATLLSALVDPLVLVAFPVFGLTSLAFMGAMAVAVVGAVRAGQDQWWRYPVSIRFVGGQERPASSR